MVHRFGGAHTKTKLDKLEEYLRAYSTALKNQQFQLIYFDAFAGAGDIQISSDDTTLLDTVDEYSPFIKGSAQRALQFKDSFDRYIFVEKDKQKIPALETLRSKHNDIAKLIDIQKGDANKQLLDFCSNTDWDRCRAVVFLDPYGNQVSWKTIVAIAETKAIDLWYLFPAGLGVYRQISKSKGVHKTHEASLDKIFGTKEWRNVFIESHSIPDLFGKSEVHEKRVTVESVTRYMAERMATVFRGGVLDEWLPLGSRNVHMYSLMFAWANPSNKAKLAGTLAQAVLRSKIDGRIK